MPKHVHLLALYWTTAISLYHSDRTLNVYHTLLLYLFYRKSPNISIGHLTNFYLNCKAFFGIVFILTSSNIQTQTTIGNKWAKLETKWVDLGLIWMCLVSIRRESIKERYIFKILHYLFKRKSPLLSLSYRIFSFAEPPTYKRQLLPDFWQYSLQSSVDHTFLTSLTLNSVEKIVANLFLWTILCTE